MGNKKQTLDPVKMKDWELAEAAEADMKPITQIAEELGLQGEELITMGKYLAKVDYQKVLQFLFIKMVPLTDIKKTVKTKPLLPAWMKLCYNRLLQQVEMHMSYGMILVVEDRKYFTETVLM